MRLSQRARRSVVIGLAATLLVLSGISVWGAAGTRASASAAATASELSQAYHRAHNAVVGEQSLERMYRVEPTPAVRTQQRLAGEDLLAALAQVERSGTAADRELVASVRRSQTLYTASVARMFTAVDRKDTVLARRLGYAETGPAFGRMSTLVQEAADRHAKAADQAVRDLHRLETIILAIDVACFGIGLLLLIVIAVVAAAYHRTLMRHAHERHHLALHDPLTGLPNRALLLDRTPVEAAVVMLNLDRFKQVNDALGHDQGDELLRQVATRIAEQVRDTDMVARLAGDEFAVLLPNADPDDTAACAQRLLDSLHRTFVISGTDVDVEVSAGFATSATAGGTPENLLRCAEIAMHAAKVSKLGAVAYRAELRPHDRGSLQLLGDLRRALDAGDELTLHYQPKVSLDDGRVSGVEALVRWQHPVRGMISPVEFIPIAESTGLINRLTRHVLRIAVIQNRSWLDDGRRIPVAVNLSPRCLLDPDLIRYVTELLAETGLPTDLLRLEVTESAVMANPTLALATLTELHALGIRLSIDDFGTGYSSMAYLKRLPVDELKIDRSFVNGVVTDHDDAVLVRSTIELGHNLGMSVVAEGAEDAGQVAALRALDCDVVQGYFFARPMPAADLITWIHERSPAVPA
ncbi:putative bifunctional diguanylate cyclase/phosphodiesterase [Micromonosporaceae bacterium Da 78-11]